MHDTLIRAIFFVFAGITLFSALMVITQNNPIRSVLFLVAAFLASSVLWLLVQAEFLALILVLVYVGAVMTLFLFVIMMLNIDREAHSAKKIRLLPIILVIVSVLVGLLQKALSGSRFFTETAGSISTITTNSCSDTEALGMVLYTDYLAAFEIAAVILLVAIIAAITLAHRMPVRSKRQNIVKQIMTRREDRVSLISMKTEK